MPTSEVSKVMSVVKVLLSCVTEPTNPSVRMPSSPSVPFQTPPCIVVVSVTLPLMVVWMSAWADVARLTPPPNPKPKSTAASAVLCGESKAMGSDSRSVSGS